MSTYPRILVVPGWYPSLLEPANGDFVQEQVRLLREYGVPVDLIFADLNVAYFSTGQVFKQRSIKIDHRGNYNYIISGPSWPKNYAFGFNRWINNYVQFTLGFISNYRRPDIIHAHTYLGAIVAAEIMNKTQIPVLVTAHFTGWINGSIRSLHKKKGIYAFQNVNEVTAVSKALSQTLEGITGRKGKVLSNFIDSNTFTIRKKREDSVLQMIIVGELIKRKQVDHAIRVLYHLMDAGQEAFLTIVGSGPEQSSLRALAKKLMVLERIFWQGRVLNSDVARILKDQDLLIHTSRLETFGLVIAEALSSGIPVISYENLGCQQFANVLGMHIIAAQKPKAMVEYIVGRKKEIMNDSPSQISISARQIFGAQVVIPQLLELYKEIGFGSTS